MQLHLLAVSGPLRQIRMSGLENVSEAVDITGRQKQCIEEIKSQTTQSTEIQWVIVFIGMIDNSFVADAAFGVFDISETKAWHHSQIDSQQVVDYIQLRHESTAEVAHFQVRSIVIDLHLIVGKVMLFNGSRHFITILVKDQFELQTEKVVGLIFEKPAQGKTTVRMNFRIGNRQIRHSIGVVGHSGSVNLTVIIVKLAANVHHVHTATSINAIMNLLCQNIDAE